jgi:hypothetical protein
MGRVHALALSYTYSETCTIHTAKHEKSQAYIRARTHAHTRRIYVNICACFLGVLMPFCTV